MYLTEDQRRHIDRLAAAEGVTMAEIVRRALDAFLADAAPDPGEALTATFGALPELVAPDRSEWDRG